MRIMKVDASPPIYQLRKFLRKVDRQTFIGLMSTAGWPVDESTVSRWLSGDRALRGGSWATVARVIREHGAKT